MPRRHGRRSAQSQEGLTHLADQPAGMERVARSPDDSRVSTLALAFESLPSFTPLCLSWFAVLSPRLTGLPLFPCTEWVAEDSTCPSAFHLSSPRYMGPLYDSLGSGGTDMETCFDAARCLLSRSALVLSSRAPIVTACHPRAAQAKSVRPRPKSPTAMPQQHQSASGAQHCTSKLPTVDQSGQPAERTRYRENEQGRERQHIGEGADVCPERRQRGVGVPRIFLQPSSASASASASASVSCTKQSLLLPSASHCGSERPFAYYPSNCSQFFFSVSQKPHACVARCLP